MELIQKAMQGNKPAVARLITIVENEAPESAAVLRKLFPETGGAKIIGITGPPGSGKSTLTDKLVKFYRKQGKTVGVIAVDPTSPFTGGAILGDRIRMSDLALDKGVFIRSMGTRGSLGGLSKATHDAIKVLDACGYDYIFIETVGVGQSEIDIVKTADTVIVVSVPGLGDDIQANKAGIMEIGDVFAVNKADTDGAQKVVIELNQMLDLNPKKTDWRPPVIKTSAVMRQGIDELVEAVEKHFEYLEKTELIKERRKNRISNEILELIMKKVSTRVYAKLSAEKFWENELDNILVKKENPYDVVERVVQEILN